MNRIGMEKMRTRAVAEKASSQKGATCTQSEYRICDGPDISGNYTKPKNRRKPKRFQMNIFTKNSRL